MDDYNRMRKLKRRFEWLGENSPKSANHLLNEYIQKLSKRKKIKVLDFGCGEGSSFDRNRNIKYYGYDIDRNNKFANFHTLKEMEGMKFDVAVLAGVVEHLDYEELKDTLKWLEKRVKNIIILTSLANYFSIGGFFNDITHKRPYSGMDTLYLINRYFKVKKFYRCGLHTLNPVKILVRFFLAYVFDSTPYTEFVVIALKSNKK